VSAPGGSGSGSAPGAASGAGSGPDPLARLREWYEAAVAAGVPEPDTMALATAAPDGAPSVRMVLLKAIDARGVQFFTNYESRKGRELAANPRAAATLYWQPQHRAVRFEGPVERLTDEESDAYFASRARGSRLGALASRQGRVLPSREALEAALADAEAAHPGDDVPRPGYWGGYRIVPDAIELWQGQPSRLHDRAHFLREPGGGWREERLSP
jgi:pyridoxamine 5'-phosphate oxidase